MQKVYLNLHKSTKPDKPKEPATTPVIVKDPKRAGQIREADKKLFEKLRTMGTVLLIGVMLFYGWYTQDISGITELGFDANPTHTPPLYDEQGLGGTFLPTPVLRHGTHRKAGPKIRRSVEDQTTMTSPEAPEVLPPGDTRCSYIICEHISDGGTNSPLLGVLEKVLNEWEKPDNADVLSITKLGLTWKNEQEFIDKLKEKNIQQPLTLVTLQLQEFKESSGKDLYTLTPENKAKIRIILRGVDATTQRLLFEETIEKDVMQQDWGNYDSKPNPSVNNEISYTYSSAMKQALAETSAEIITLLHKYFP